MKIRDGVILILGGAGLVGQAVARRLARRDPAKLVLASLRKEESEGAVEALGREPELRGVELVPAWGDLFVPDSMKDRSWQEIAADGDDRSRLIDDLYGELTEEVFGRSALGRLLVELRPGIVVDCVNTAGALAYQDVFASVAALRRTADEERADPEAVERHLATLYLPKLIRHVQVALEGMKRAETEIYVKVGTSGTGGMGLNIPFTHSEERPSRVLLAKAGLAGAHTLLLFLMARTPGAPSVKEVKPTAAISWKSVGSGPIRKGGRVVKRVDATEAIPLERAFEEDVEGAYRTLDEPLEGVYLDAGENGLFSVGEFEALTALGLMEFVTPEEIADAVEREIRGHPTGLDVVAALDASTLGPSYRAGVLRSSALKRMEVLEGREESRAVAYEMLGPPRLSKLLFEAEILRRGYATLDAAASLEADDAAARAAALIRGDGDLRQRIVTIGLPILLSDGSSVLRGPEVKVPPTGMGGEEPDERILARGWIDLRAENWKRWRGRVRELARELRSRSGIEEGSRGDHEYGDDEERIRPGRLAAWIFRHEDAGERIKR